MPTPPGHVIALLTFDPTRQSCTKPFYLNALKSSGIEPHSIDLEVFFDGSTELQTLLENLNNATSLKKRQSVIREMLTAFPASGAALLRVAQTSSNVHVALACSLALRELAAEILKTTSLDALDPQMSHLLAVIGVEQLFDAMIMLKKDMELIQAAIDQITLLPNNAPWVYSIILARAAVLSGEQGLYPIVRDAFRLWAKEDQERLNTLQLADLVHNYVTYGPNVLHSRLVQQFSRVPRTEMILDEIRSYALDVPDLPDILSRSTPPPTVLSRPSFDQLVADDERARELSILASSLIGDKRDECLALAAEQYPHSLWTWLGHVYNAKSPAEQLIFADKGLACAPIMMADPSTTPFVDLLAGKGRALFAMGEYDIAFDVIERLFMLQTADVTEMYEAFLSLLIAKGPEHFDRAELLINDMIEIGNYYPALPWLQLLMQIVQQRPPSVIVATLAVCLQEMPWIGLMIAGYAPMESSHDPGPPDDLDLDMMSITLYIVQHAYDAYPTAQKRLRTLLK